MNVDTPASDEADGPRCRYCGADCSDGRSWDGGDLYACPPCADARAARNIAASPAVPADERHPLSEAEIVGQYQATLDPIALKRDRLTRLLGEHRLIGGFCRCGFNARLDYFRYEQHVADAILAAAAAPAVPAEAGEAEPCGDCGGTGRAGSHWEGPDYEDQPCSACGPLAFADAFVDAVLEEPVSWEVGNLTLTVGDIVQIARRLAPVAERLAAVSPVLRESRR